MIGYRVTISRKLARYLIHIPAEWSPNLVREWELIDIDSIFSEGNKR